MITILGPYKGYLGQFDIDFKAGVLYGEVLDVNDVIAFEGLTVPELIRSFEDSVDDYLAFCKEQHREPQRPFSGKFPFRTDPAKHRLIYTAAQLAGKSMNAWMEEELVADAAGFLALCGVKVEMLPSQEVEIIMGSPALQVIVGGEGAVVQGAPEELRDRNVIHAARVTIGASGTLGTREIPSLEGTAGLRKRPRGRIISRSGPVAAKEALGPPDANLIRRAAK